MSREAVSVTRCVLVWLAATVAVAGLLGWAVGDLAAQPRPEGFEDGLVWACEVVSAGCAAWLWVVTGVVTADAVRGRSHLRRGVPLGVRRVVLGACGVALVGGAVSAPSYAADHRPERPHSVLAGLPVPDRATALTELAAVFASVRHGHGHHEAPVGPPPERHVRVRPGDTLWGLALGTLPPAADDLAVSERWQRLYRLNRGVIGADPDLIVPGQRLVLPTGSEEDL